MAGLINEKLPGNPNQIIKAIYEKKRQIMVKDTMVSSKTG